MPEVLWPSSLLPVTPDGHIPDSGPGGLGESSELPARPPQAVAEQDTGAHLQEEKGIRASAPSKAHTFAGEVGPQLELGSSLPARSSPLSPPIGLRQGEEGQEQAVVSLPSPASWSQVCLPQLTQGELGSTHP